MIFTVRENTIRAGWKDQNTLKFRVRLAGNATLEWYRRIWIRDESGKRATQHTYIRKRNKSKGGNSYSYDLEDLFKYSPEWSRDMVVEVESEAATLRRQARAPAIDPGQPWPSGALSGAAGCWRGACGGRSMNMAPRYLLTDRFDLGMLATLRQPTSP